MTRLATILGTILLLVLAAVPAASAAEPWTLDDHFLLSTGGDVELSEAHHADILVVVDGDATIRGDVGGILVIDGTATLIGASTQAIVAIRGHVSLDAATVVAGDVRTLDSTLDRAAGSTITGSVSDLGPELAGASVALGAINGVLYLGFVLVTLALGLALAGFAARQVRSAEALISREPVTTFVAAIAGIVGIVVLGALVTVTVIGIPLGLGILTILLPAMAVVGYVVAGIWLGDRIVGLASAGVARERPYLASLVGLTILGAVSVLPVVGGLASLFGFGAVVLGMWRTIRRRPMLSEPLPQAVAVPARS